MNINPKNIISTGCCEKANQFKTVYLDFDYEEHKQSDCHATLKPRWYSKGVQEIYEGSNYFLISSVEVTFCPFCAKQVPEIERNKKAPKKRIQNGDGDYCHTCDERLMSCDCLPPTFSWKPVGVEVFIPSPIKRNED